MGDVRTSLRCPQCGSYGLCLAGQWILLVPLLPSSEGLWVIYTQRVASAGELRKDSVGWPSGSRPDFMMVQTPSFGGGEEAALAIPNSK